uniref:Uncharacterized protein n=1 Tax=Lepeophtheirus salmonis TaxID=72036 RepID=A0A0K2T4J2_LEPSM
MKLVKEAKLERRRQSENEQVIYSYRELIVFFLLRYCFASSLNQ